MKLLPMPRCCGIATDACHNHPQPGRRLPTGNAAYLRFDRRVDDGSMGWVTGDGLLYMVDRGREPEADLRDRYRTAFLTHEDLHRQKAFSGSG